MLDLISNLCYTYIVPRGDDDHSEEIFGGAVKKRTRISTPEGWLIRRGHQKIFSETSEKPLDNHHKLWYNDSVRGREDHPLKEREGRV